MKLSERIESWCGADYCTCATTVEGWLPGIKQLEKDLEACREELNKRGDYQCSGCHGWFKSQRLLWKGVKQYRCMSCVNHGGLKVD